MSSVSRYLRGVRHQRRARKGVGAACRRRHERRRRRGRRVSARRARTGRRSPGRRTGRRCPTRSRRGTAGSGAGARQAAAGKIHPKVALSLAEPIRSVAPPLRAPRAAATQRRRARARGLRRERRPAVARPTTTGLSRDSTHLARQVAGRVAGVRAQPLGAVLAVPGGGGREAGSVSGVAAAGVLSGVKKPAAPREASPHAPLGARRALGALGHHGGGVLRSGGRRARQRRRAGERIGGARA
jgi:hypothetical protein